MSIVPGREVICRVDRLQAGKAEVSVIAVVFPEGNTETVKHSLRGSIRLQDVRSFDIDKADIQDHFLPGDIVRAFTLSTGDVKSCFFSTVGQRYGVISAKDNEGNELLPMDESHMKNKDGLIFRRKVAKPDWIPNVDSLKLDS